LKEGRLYFSQPFLRRFPLRTTASSYVRRETHEDFNTDRLGLSLQQQAKFWEHYILNYGYRFERTHTYELIPDPLFDQSLRVAPLTTSLSRETRDDIFDATRGSFLSNAFEYGSSFLGSDLKYVKYFAQFSKYFAFDDPQPIPFQKNVRKSRLVFATQARVGLAGGLGGQDLIPGRSQSGLIGLGERFFAGGGTTIRGFEQDGVGPRLPGGGPAGGDALFILNEEIRFPLFSILDGVGFLDVGNVYEKASDFSFTDVRKSAGMGLRIRTPYFLIRFDYGVKLDRKPGETRAKPFFSIGQSF
jgi:outer membrane protein insertion porin family